MNLYIENTCTDPHYNLALEQFVFDSLDRKNSYIWLWQNDNSIIVGKHQNTRAEINTRFVNENRIKLARRLSGGGAVYHDLGNVNFTFIRDSNSQKAIDFAAFCEPVRQALIAIGVPAEITGRNDMTVDGKKFSGNAQYVKNGRVMHHGTILYDSDLGVLSRALNPGEDKIESRGIKSVKTRVTNIKPYMKRQIPAREFIAELRNYLFSAFDLKILSLTDEQKEEVNVLKENRYSRWNWNYGSSPAYNIRKTRRIEGCGKLEIYLDVAEEGIIKNAAFCGDFFGNREPQELADKLRGHHLEYNELKAVIENIDISEFFHALDSKSFLTLLFE